MDFSVTIKGTTLPVAVSLKKMKQVRLKVFPNNEIKLSAPNGTPEEWIAEYLLSKTPWIEEKLDLFVQTRAIEKEEHFTSGSSTRIMGQQMTILVHKAAKKQIIQEDRFLQVFTPEIEQKNIDKQVNNWWQQTSKKYYQSIVNRLYPIIEKHGVAKPIICVKKMSTLWGSCSRTKHTINLNFYLYKASVPCIEYVILHEMAHFLYPFHNREFYEFLTIHMPDWKERKKQLDTEVVQGL